ncbi:MAG: YbaK/EbsC family protein [Desulfobacterales bacterium]|nr:YbaK/EbsC family protein [Candidatus Omnitrophota bacterium]MCG2775635.1 YbaK/EbsC family protein [Desulfobacterales bacterium]
MVYDEIMRTLRQKGVPFTIHKHEPVMTMQDVEEKLPFPKEKLLKTLVFKIRNSFWILAVVKGQDKVDYHKLASSFGVNLDALVRPSAEEMESELGFQIGGICPIPTNDSIKAVFDNDILDMEVVYCGVGRNDRSLEIRLQDLLHISNARVWPIAHEKHHF